jgi:hypothetical protein
MILVLKLCGRKTTRIVTNELHSEAGGISNMKYRLMVIAVLLPFFTSFTLAENGSEDSALANAEIKDAMLSLEAKINTQYVEKEIATKLVIMLSQKKRDRQYYTQTSPEDFIDTLNKDLLSISHDKHLRVMFTPRGIDEWLHHQENSQNPNDNLKFIDNNSNYDDNFGFSEVKILEGNIGYLKLTAFYSPEVAKDTLAREMTNLSSVKAIIIDLRENHGGSPEMVQLFSSYFFGSTPVHLNTFYIRPQDEYIETWTHPNEPVIRRPNVSLYILTSHLTFSAAEEFSYNLRNLKRAIIIGETTAGGAHAGDFQQLTDRFFVYMPFAKAINPITNTNWEGIGVKPNVKVKAENALLIAHKTAKKILAKSHSH